ncbi:glycosyltransferase involved in cell wall biosynthesis [Rhizobium sp. BK313]|uniref:glycosyltransferase family 4 protein n=1 Tax=Rhizobium sp. BK313 TaxID=2587081 RepID=UPI0014151310|nr:glycosyltransferase family 1 protein [Rhizobium sp. BK313]MBB3457287.1 glycosyltransferase involved in cell wall biosynthesis [Rhizobium sp. BK313]
MLGIVDNHPDVELLVSLNAAMPLEALAARDHLQKWIKPGNIHIWHGAAEAGEAINGYTEKRRLSEVALAYHVACLKPDIALSTSPFEGVGEKAVPLVPNDISGMPIASIFYDAIPYRYPQQYLTSSAMRAYYHRRLALYSRYDLNLCISEYSRNECVEISRNHRSINILAGVSKDFIDAIEHPDIRMPQSIEKPFILYVGALDWRKNVKSAIQAFAQLPSDVRDRYSFVLAGDHPRALLKDEEDRWKKLGLPEKDLVVLGHVTDSQLVSLYKATDLAIQPSLLEGFGLTALEAMTCGAPIIASNTGALPEVIGDEELLFDPADVNDIVRVMKHALTHPEATKSVAERQRCRAQEFSWAKSAAIAVEALKKAAAAANVRPVGAEASASAIQEAVLRNLEDTTVPTDAIAETLARSEKVASAGARLIVDATATYRVDHKTGIQRVVKNICANLGAAQDESESGGIEKVIAYSDSSDGWFSIPNTLEKSASPLAFTEDNRLEFSSDDVILMLDSSWEFYRHHYMTLRSARLRGARVISCLYDTIPLRFPAFCSPIMPPIFSAWFQTALSYSTAFVCISKAVADELTAFLEAIQFPREMKIGYWHLGADFAENGGATAIDPVRQDERPSILMVGTLEPRKGHSVALAAFEQLWDEGLDISLTIVGKPGWGVEHLVRKIEGHSEYGRRLFWHNGISDDQLQNEYARCNALLAASYAEGFGLPIVEAGHFGKSVIASDIPVFREVTARGQNCQFFTPGSAESLADAVRSFLAAADGPQKNAEVNNWTTWGDSSKELERVVLTEDWYKIYRPTSDKAYVPISNIGMTTMVEPLPPSDTQNEIELVDGPADGGSTGTVKYTLRVTNLSEKLWSSLGANDGSFAITLGCRVLSDDGRTVLDDRTSARIPFVLPPKESLYISIDIPSDLKKRGGAYAELGLFQKAVGWSRGPLRVPL